MPQQPQQQQQRHPVRQIDGKMGAVDIDVTGARLLSRLPSREGDGYMTHLYLQYQTHTMTFKEREAISQRWRRSACNGVNGCRLSTPLGSVHRTRERPSTIIATTETHRFSTDYHVCFVVHDVYSNNSVNPLKGITLYIASS